MMRCWTVAVVGLVAGGCATVGPDYQRPALDLPVNYRWQAMPVSSGSFGDQDWWRVYQDPRLQNLIKTALAQNFDVRIAAARIEQARATLGSTRLQQLPVISIGSSAGRSNSSALLSSQSGGNGNGNDNGSSNGSDAQGGSGNTGGSSGSLNTFTLGLDISYELDLWGRLRRLTEAARAQLLASREAQQAVIVSLVASVATTYFDLVSFDQQLDITRRTVATRQKFVDLTRAQHEGGVVSGLDVSTAEAQLALAQANVPDLERQIAQTENRLSILLGENPQSIQRAPGATIAHAPPVPPAGLPSDLLARRPDLRQAEQNLVAANALVGAARAALFPSISLTGALGIISTDLARLFTGPAGTWALGVSLVQPLLDPQRSRYQIDLADAQKREALLQYQQAVQNAFREVADALIAQQKYAEFQQAQQTQVDALRRAENIALARYRIGFSSYFDVINAERDLFSAELTLAAAYRNAQLSMVQLYQALGGGWQVDDKPLTETAAAQ